MSTTNYAITYLYPNIDQFAITAVLREPNEFDEDVFLNEYPFVDISEV